MKTALLAVLLLTACVSPRATLVNKQGEVATCAANGFGLITGVMAHYRYKDCVTSAQKEGYVIRDAN